MSQVYLFHSPFSSSTRICAYPMLSGQPDLPGPLEEGVDRSHGLGQRDKEESMAKPPALRKAVSIFSVTV